MKLEIIITKNKKKKKKKTRKIKIGYLILAIILCLIISFVCIHKFEMKQESINPIIDYISMISTCILGGIFGSAMNVYKK